jgi:LETM1 and EF-hand domain-containing protein 1
MRLRHLKTDDKLIIKEGLNNMTVQELQLACKERGMRALGLTEAALKRQMQEWLDLSQNAKVPPSLLLLSRTLYFADGAQPTEQVINEICLVHLIWLKSSLFDVLAVICLL